MFDYHTHSEYSDGSEMESMVQAATAADLDGIGFADHCNVTSEAIRKSHEYFLHETYESRRDTIRALNDAYQIRIFDAVEVDYYPHDEARIRRFLESADFEYTIGSVHYIRDRHVSNTGFFQEKSRGERRRLVDEYVDRLVQLLESDLFDIAAHLDVLERYRPFHDFLAESHYAAVADALAASRTIPEINVGRLFSEYGETHPRSEFITYLADRGVEFTFGTDAHSPDVLRRGVAYYRETLAESDLQFVAIDCE